MKILASADIHGCHAVYRALPGLVRAHRVDLVVLAGDLLGYTEGTTDIAEAQRADARAIADILRSLQVSVLYVMGNDDWVDLDPPAGPFMPIHGRRIDLGDFNFVGYRYSLPFMGGVNEKAEEEIAEDMASLERLMDRRTILVTHSPAAGILDLGILDRHAGSPSILAAVERRSVRAHIHGHVHHCFGRQGVHFNVSAAGELRAVLLDLDTMRHEEIGAGFPDS